MIQKTLYDSNCDLEMAIHWSTSAHNTLTNVYGFSPNQLVFGHNPSLPTVHSDRPTAQNELSSSQLIHNNLKALHAAREAFIKQESCEKLRRALNRKVRPCSFFSNGDKVYYKRNDNQVWHGPATVLGKDSQNYLLKHGGIYIRVHPCRLQLTENDNHTEVPKILETSTEQYQQQETSEVLSILQMMKMSTLDLSLKVHPMKKIQNNHLVLLMYLFLLLLGGFFLIILRLTEIKKILSPDSEVAIHATTPQKIYFLVKVCAEEQMISNSKRPKKKKFKGGLKWKYLKNIVIQDNSPELPVDGF